MKKVLLGFAAAMLIVAFVVAGCGSKSASNKPATSQAKQVLDSSQAKMQDVQTVKMTGTATVLTPQSETKSETIKLDGQVKILSKTDAEMHMSATASNGQVTDIYVIGGYEYTNDPVKGWTKQKVTPGQFAQSGAITPESISSLTKYAENMKLAPDQNGMYVITFNVGPQFFEQALNQASSASTGDASADQAAQQLSQTLKDMLKGIQMTAVYKVNKSTMLADSANIKMFMKGAPVLGDVTVTMNMTFTDYNAPVTITLPPEAAGAQEVQPSPSGVPNLPSIPGLGL